jgi:hypothetical protein
VTIFVSCAGPALWEVSGIDIASPKQVRIGCKSFTDICAYLETGPPQRLYRFRAANVGCVAVQATARTRCRTPSNAVSLALTRSRSNRAGRFRTTPFRWWQQMIREPAGSGSQGSMSQPDGTSLARTITASTRSSPWLRFATKPRGSSGAPIGRLRLACGGSLKSDSKAPARSQSAAAFWACSTGIDWVGSASATGIIRQRRPAGGAIQTRTHHR